MLKPTFMGARCKAYFFQLVSKTRSCIGVYPLDPPLLVLVTEHVVHEDLEGLALADGVVQHDGLKNRLL